MDIPDGQKISTQWRSPEFEKKENKKEEKQEKKKSAKAASLVLTEVGHE